MDLSVTLGSQTYTFDPAAISGLDALDLWAAGFLLEPILERLRSRAEAGQAPSFADAAVAKWLALRQSDDPFVPLVRVAAATKFPVSDG